MITASMRATSVWVRMKPPSVSQARPMTSAVCSPPRRPPSVFIHGRNLWPSLTKKNVSISTRTRLTTADVAAPIVENRPELIAVALLRELLLHRLDGAGDLALGQAERTAGEPVAHLLQAAGRAVGELGACPATCGVRTAMMPDDEADEPQHDGRGGESAPARPCERSHAAGGPRTVETMSASATGRSRPRAARRSSRATKTAAAMTMSRRPQRCSRRRRRR